MPAATAAPSPATALVLDASAALALLLGAPGGAVVAARVGRARALHAPHLIDLEVAQVLRRYVRAREITAARAEAALADLGDLRLARHPHEPFLGRIWQLRAVLTAYDAVYVALAEALAAPLLTLDSRLARAPGVTARVDLVG